MLPLLKLPQSSHQKWPHDPGSIYLTVLNTKRRRKERNFSIIAPALWMLLLYCLRSPCGNNLALATPVEEDPQNYGSRANEGVGFSLNSPRNSDRNRANENRGNQKSSSLANDRKGIKVN